MRDCMRGLTLRRYVVLGRYQTVGQGDAIPLAVRFLQSLVRLRDISFESLRHGVPHKVPLYAFFSLGIRLPEQHGRAGAARGLFGELRTPRTRGRETCPARTCTPPTSTTVPQVSSLFSSRTRAPTALRWPARGWRTAPATVTLPRKAECIAGEGRAMGRSGSIQLLKKGALLTLKRIFRPRFSINFDENVGRLRPTFEQVVHRAILFYTH